MQQFLGKVEIDIQANPIKSPKRAASNMQNVVI